MAVNYYFQDKVIKQGAEDGYLHFFALNANADPQSVYAPIVAARDRIAAIASQYRLTGRVNRAAVSPLDTDTKATVERLLTGRLFEDISPGFSYIEGEDIPSGDSVAATLNAVADEFKDKMVGVNNFAQSVEQVIQSIFNAGNINMIAKDYCQQILQEYLQNNGMGGSYDSAIARQVISSILSRHNGQFFTVDQYLGGSGLNATIKEMAAIVAALPDAGLTGKEVIAVGNRHTNIETALSQKFNGWLQMIGMTASKLASAIGLGEVSIQAYDEIARVMNSVKSSQDVIVQNDIRLIDDAQKCKAALSELLGSTYGSGIVSVTVNKGGIGVNFNLSITPPTVGGYTGNINTSQVDIYIIEEMSLLDVLANQAGFGGSSLNQLLQILTYQDSPNFSGAEAAAAQVWNLIVETVPYLALMSQLINTISSTGVTYNNMYFAYGGKIYPATEVLSRMLQTIGSNSNLAKTMVSFTASDIARENFAEQNRFILSEGKVAPSSELAIQRSNLLRSRTMSMLMASKVEIMARLAELAILSFTGF